MTEIDINSIKRFPESPAITQEEVDQTEELREPKLVIERESYEMIYKSGYVECLNHLEKFMSETRGVTEEMIQWIEQQRKTLNKYL